MMDRSLSPQATRLVSPLFLTFIHTNGMLRVCMSTQCRPPQCRSQRCKHSHHTISPYPHTLIGLVITGY